MGLYQGFDNRRYVESQSEKILERIRNMGSKLYLEFGGKLFDDMHAARVLPGFESNAKVKILQTLSDQAEIIFCIGAPDIEHNRIRGDSGLPYHIDVMRLIDRLRSLGLTINSVVITQYSGQPSADIFRKKLELRGESTYVHTLTKGYPTDVDTIVSDEGYGQNPFIPTARPLVVVTAPGAGSGKLGTCLSQMYHEYKNGVQAGYAKFETFPIWNIPLKHPVNLAYEAATADLRDVNMIDPFHMEAYGETAVNYNRDIEVFPVLRTILQKIMGKSPYRSPTDMGVNMAGFFITDDEAVRRASGQEIIRRYFRAECEYKQGLADIKTAKKVKLLMNELGLDVENRTVVAPALRKAEKEGVPAMALELRDGRIITGKTTPQMKAAASAVINAIKELSGVSDDLHLIPPVVLDPILKLLRDTLRGGSDARLGLEEALLALSLCVATNPLVELALSKLPLLAGCEAHSSVMLTRADESIFHQFGMNLTCEPEYPTKDLYFV